MALVDRILIYENHAIEIVFKYKDEYQQTLEYVLAMPTNLPLPDKGGMSVWHEKAEKS